MKIRYFEDEIGQQLRILDSHFRTIFLNHHAVYLPIPRSVCLSKLDINGSIDFYAWAFMEDHVSIDLDILVWPPPFSHFSLFTPMCHPISNVGRDQFERSFNGMLTSFFSSKFCHISNRQIFRKIGSFRAWSAMSCADLLNKLSEEKNWKLKDILIGVPHSAHTNPSPSISRVRSNDLFVEVERP